MSQPKNHPNKQRIFSYNFSTESTYPDSSSSELSNKTRVFSSLSLSFSSSEESKRIFWPVGFALLSASNRASKRFFMIWNHSKILLFLDNTILWTWLNLTYPTYFHGKQLYIKYSITWIWKASILTHTYFAKLKKHESMNDREIDRLQSFISDPKNAANCEKLFQQNFSQNPPSQRRPTLIPRWCSWNILATIFFGIIFLILISTGEISVLNLTIF